MEDNNVMSNTVAADTEITTPPAEQQKTPEQTCHR